MSDLEREMLEALKGLLAHAPKPKRIKDDFSYVLYLEAARKAVAKAGVTMWTAPIAGVSLFVPSLLLVVA